MAVVSGPLMSLAASGKVADTLVFATWKGRPYVRQLVTPANPNSGSQLSRRAMQRFLSQYWTSLSGADQALWAPGAASRAISPFNEYMGQNQKDWTQFTPPKYSPTQAAGTPATTAVVTATGGVGQASLSIALGTLNQSWGTAVFAKLGSAPSGIFTEVAFIVLSLATPATCEILQLVPGTWHFKARNFTNGGAWGTIGADANAVVT